MRQRALAAQVPPLVENDWQSRGDGSLTRLSVARGALL